MTQHIYMLTHNYCVQIHTQIQEFAITNWALWSFSLTSWSIFGSVKKIPLFAVQSTRQVSMVNLEKLLLAASGRLATTEEHFQWPPPRQRRRKLSFAGDEKDNDHAGSSRKLSLPQLPKKKDLAILKNDDGSENREGGIGDNNNNINEIVGSGLHKVDDQEKLSKLSEHDMILDACATEKTDKNLTKILKKRTDKQREGSSHKVHVQKLKGMKHWQNWSSEEGMLLVQGEEVVINGLLTRWIYLQQM